MPENSMRETTTYIRLLRTFSSENLNLFICEFDNKNQTFLTVSKSCENILGYTQEEMTGENFIKFCIPEYHKKSKEAAFINFQHPEPINAHINGYRKKNGDNLLMLWYADDARDGGTVSWGIPVDQHLLLELIIQAVSFYPGLKKQILELLR